MRDDPRAFLTVDAGSATIALGLIGRIGSRWRLVGRLALPAGAEPDAAIALLVERATTADPELTSRIGLDRTPISELPRLAVSSRTPRRLAVVAGSERALGPLVAAASRSGWHVRSASAEAVDPLEMTTLLLDVGVDAILAGAGDPPAADERRGLAELGALVAAAAHRRPDLPVILAGGMAGERHAFGDLSDRLGRVLVAAAARAAGGSDLRGLLTSVALPEDDARRALGGAVAALSDVLDRRVDVVDIGYDAGTRAAAWPAGPTDAPASDLAIVPSAGLAPADPDDDAIDRIATWSTWTSDRHRLRDRMRELRIAPWADAAGEGAALRMAAVRAALSCLARWTPGWEDRPAADLVVATGGAWAVATPSAIALALADVLRRAGASQVALDHARLLAPLGVIPDASERRAMVADLAEDLLVPIGTVVTPGGLRHGRSAGSLEIHGVTGDRRRDLRPGGLERIPLAPGGTAVAEFRFHDAVRLGGRGRHFVLDVTGGLGGLLVDLRDVPLRLPDRAELRSELLDAWQAAVASGDGP